MNRHKEKLVELLRYDMRGKYRDSFFAKWEGINMHAQRRFVPTTNADDVRMVIDVPMSEDMGYVIDSHDGGNTWEGPGVPFPPACSGSFILSDGTIIAVQGGRWCWRSTDKGQHWKRLRITGSDDVQYDGIGGPNCQGAIKLVRRHLADRIVTASCYFTGEEGPDLLILSSSYSDDGGLTWKVSKLFRPPAHLAHCAEGFSEPAVVEMPSGWLWMVYRTEYSELWQSLSRDGGQSWTRPSPTGFVSPIANCHAFREPSTGATVLCWNAAIPGIKNDFHTENSIYRPRTNLVWSVSYDNTHTWTEPVVVESKGGQYPNIWFAAGRMFIMYQESSGKVGVAWENMGLTLVAYDIKDVLALPAMTQSTIQSWVDRGLIRPWRATACAPATRKTIS